QDTGSDIAVEIAVRSGSLDHWGSPLVGVRTRRAAARLAWSALFLIHRRLPNKLFVQKSSYLFGPGPPRPLRFRFQAPGRQRRRGGECPQIAGTAPSISCRLALPSRWRVAAPAQPLATRAQRSEPRHAGRSELADRIPARAQARGRYDGAPEDRPGE